MPTSFANCRDFGRVSGVCSELRGGLRTGIASDSDGGGGGGGRGDGGRGGLLPTAGVGSPLVGTGRQPNPDTTKGQKKKKKKQRKRTTSNSTEPPVSPIELAAADFDEERAAYEKAIRVQQQQLSSLTRALDNQQAERKAAVRPRACTPQACGALVYGHGPWY